MFLKDRKSRLKNFYAMQKILKISDYFKNILSISRLSQGDIRKHFNFFSLLDLERGKKKFSAFM